MILDPGEWWAIGARRGLGFGLIQIPKRFVLCTRGKGGDSMKISGSVGRQFTRESDDYSIAPRVDLLWSHFCGDVQFESSAGRIATNFGWVPLLHVALSLTDICSEFQNSAQSVMKYQFTESDDYISFDLSENVVNISATFSGTSFSAPLRSYCSAVADFGEELVIHLGDRNSSFRANPVAAEVLSEVEELRAVAGIARGEAAPE